MRFNKKILFSVLFLILVLIFVYNIKNTQNFTIGGDIASQRRKQARARTLQRDRAL